MEDREHRTPVLGASAQRAASLQALLELIPGAQALRTARPTQTKEASSRSHAAYHVYRGGEGPGSPILTLVDCAGSELGEDSAYHDAQTRKDAAEINSTIFALKACFRVMRSSTGQPPYRKSLFMRVLSDSFSGDPALIAALGKVSPSAAGTELSIGTLCALQQLLGTRIFSLGEPSRRSARPWESCPIRLLDHRAPLSLGEPSCRLSARPQELCPVRLCDHRASLSLGEPSSGAPCASAHHATDHAAWRSSGSEPWVWCSTPVCARLGENAPMQRRGGGPTAPERVVQRLGCERGVGAAGPGGNPLAGNCFGQRGAQQNHPQRGGAWRRNRPPSGLAPTSQRRSRRACHQRCWSPAWRKRRSRATLQMGQGRPRRRRQQRPIEGQVRLAEAGGRNQSCGTGGVLQCLSHVVAGGGARTHEPPEYLPRRDGGQGGEVGAPGEAEQAAQGLRRCAQTRVSYGKTSCARRRNSLGLGCSALVAFARRAAAKRHGRTPG